MKNKKKHKNQIHKKPPKATQKQKTKTIKKKTTENKH